ncbi:carbohydrate ABC transporter, N-acetylglucosamine/diacetylchitobiose-binding protein [Clostridia bacterium]|nr:carbohydrate ABC transporter, N-acetylglucosamine/diacetylchitobiose-binding protein [Clostridia bacterium]
MKKLFSVFAVAALAVISIAGFGGCVNKNTGEGIDSDPVSGPNGNLQIGYYAGGAGTVWIKDLATAFYKETGVRVYLNGDAQMTEKTATLLESGRNLPDLVFVLYTNWQDYVRKGQLEPLDTIYDGTFDGLGISSKYDGKTLSQSLVPEFENYGYMGKTVLTPEAEKHYYVMPWTAPVTGFVYNADMLASVGYNEPPKTEAELKDLCAKLNDIGKAPFAWGGFGMDIGYWDFPVITWWAQHSGINAWKSFYEFESADVFNDPGREQALRLFQDLLVDGSGNWKNSMTNPGGKNHIDAERDFVSGNAAMIPTGSWIENEIRGFIRDGFKMRMMRTPAIEGAVETDVCNTEAGDFAAIPSGAEHKDWAKAFLAFMNRPENVEKFTQTTGMPRPFQYQPSKLAGITEFQKSCFQLYENSSNMWRNSKSPIFTYVGTREWAQYGNNTIYGKLANGSQKKSPQELNKEMYDYAAGNWDVWKASIGL